jgi:hypothetical protein
MSTDGKSVVINNDTLELYGYANAAIGQIPHKSEEGLE